MELLAARVDGARRVVGVGWRSGSVLESGFDTSSTHALLVAPPALEYPMLRYFSLSHIQLSKINFRVTNFPLDIFIFVEFRFRVCNQNFLTLPQFGDAVR